MIFQKTPPAGYVVTTAWPAWSSSALAIPLVSAGGAVYQPAWAEDVYRAWERHEAWQASAVQRVLHAIVARASRIAPPADTDWVREMIVLYELSGAEPALAACGVCSVHASAERARVAAGRWRSAPKT